MTIDEFLTIECGVILVDRIRRYAFVAHKVEENEDGRTIGISNCIDLINRELMDHASVADTSEMFFSTPEEHDKYFDIMRENQTQGYPHNEGDKLVYAGSLLVFDDQYICYLLNNVPKGEFSTHNWSAMNAMDMKNGWESCNLADQGKGKEPRLANKRERKRFWRQWADYIDNLNNKSEKTYDLQELCKEIKQEVPDLFPRIKHKVINNYIYTPDDKVRFIGTAEECEEWMEENSAVYEAAGIDLLWGFSVERIEE